MEPNFSFGYWLKRQRLARDLRQADLAQQLGIATITLRKLEADDRRPSLQLVERLAALFQLDEAERAIVRHIARSDLSPVALPLPAQPAAVAAPASPLPPQPTPFIGRAQELAALGELLATEHGRLVTICGPGGMGKTRLALAAAAAPALRRRAPDGLAFVALAPVREVAQLDAALALALGLQLAPPGPRQPGPRAQILSYLRARQMLLILDNCEHLLRETGAIVGALLAEATSLRVLATSRERLGLRGEQLFLLGGLSAGADDDAGGLFFATAARIQPGLDQGLEQRQTVRRICELLGGMPLAIELAAGWADTLTLDEIEAELRADGLGLLASAAPDMPERHRSMHAVLSATWQQLAADDRLVAARFAVFRGGCTREAAQTVAGATLQLLNALVRKSLVQHSPGADRYGVHELLRQYMDEQLARDAEQRLAVFDRHADYYLRALAAHAEALEGDGHVAALEAIGRERLNIGAAWAHAVERAMLPQIAAASDVLGAYYEWQGYLQEGEAAFRAGARLAEALGGAAEAVYPRLRTWHGVFCALTGRLDAARAALAQALAACARAPDVLRAEHAFALWRLGQIEVLGGGNAELHFLESLEHYRALRREWACSAVLTSLGEVYLLQARFAEARRALEAARASCERRGDGRGLSQALEALSQLALTTGELDDALSLARQSYELAETLGQRSRAVDALGRLGIVLMHLGHYAESLPYLERSLARYQESGDLAMTALAHNRLTLALLHHGDEELGRQRAEMGVGLSRGPGGWHLAQALMLFAFANYYTDPAAADAAVDEGIALCRAQGLSTQLAQLLTTQSDIAWLRGDRGRAQASAVEGLRLALEQRSLMTLEMALPPCVLPLVAAGRAERAAEIYGLSVNSSYWRGSRLLAPYLERLLGGLRGALTPEALEAGRARGAGLERWATAEALLADLEAAGWSAAQGFSSDMRGGGSGLP